MTKPRYSRKTCTGNRAPTDDQYAWAPGELESIRRLARIVRESDQLLLLAMRDIDVAYKRFAYRYGWSDVKFLRKRSHG
jgi:hypothetical protein